tara:strand:+ start:410 stop:529 length:120 start_codon:yes stop_codon:yes gene_type:complete
MGISEAIFNSFRMVVIDLVIKMGLATMVLLFGISWLLSL